jgi:hypothetical protein
MRRIMIDDGTDGLLSCPLLYYLPVYYDLCQPVHNAAASENDHCPHYGVENVNKYVERRSVTTAGRCWGG